MRKLASVTAKTPQSRQYNQSVPLEENAARLYPESEHNQAAWIREVRYLRRGAASIWTLDKLVTASGTQRY
jgi:hypothetical protein